MPARAACRWAWATCRPSRASPSPSRLTGTTRCSSTPTARPTRGTPPGRSSPSTAAPPSAAGGCYETLVDRLGRELTRYVGHAPDDDVALLLVYRDVAAPGGQIRHSAAIQRRRSVNDSNMAKFAHGTHGDHALRRGSRRDARRRGQLPRHPVRGQPHRAVAVPGAGASPALGRRSRGDRARSDPA